ncbi:hypothetical protein THIOM_004116 [Candidatus Thiomargarita nelsonii]|uniref:Uncharacterized protein n=1 Tax=Candidatus Thiomargarita nelsonii TaxID=1003181 RepID=A0A176RWR8_9GAMM|nr:hypothetical protein THIOM_004116 [Candidatus Thiomargarita nelsonii]
MVDTLTLNPPYMLRGAKVHLEGFYSLLNIRCTQHSDKKRRSKSGTFFVAVQGTPCIPSEINLITKFNHLTKTDTRIVYRNLCGYGNYKSRLFQHSYCGFGQYTILKHAT